MSVKGKQWVCHGRECGGGCSVVWHKLVGCESNEDCLPLELRNGDDYSKRSRQSFSCNLDKGPFHSVTLVTFISLS